MISTGVAEVRLAMAVAVVGVSLVPAGGLSEGIVRHARPDPAC
ncbi:MAG: hypothetical protein ACM3ZU_00515 [Bacteroidota bacterium]